MSETVTPAPMTLSTTDPLTLVNTPTRAKLLDSIQFHWNNGRGFTVATLNLDHIVKLRSSAGFSLAYQSHSHVVADGNPIVWLSRLAGKRIELVPGSELIDPLAALAAQNKIPVALLGATQETLDTAAERLAQKHTGLWVVARIAPPFGFDPEGSMAVSVLTTIKESGAKLCFIALGAPKQEILAVKGSSIAPECGFVSVGAGLDFIAGAQKRAPKWVQKLAMEWGWRMLNNPRRLMLRYGRCILILPHLTFGALRTRFLHTEQQG